MTTPHIAGLDLYSATITLPRTGVWSARVVHDGETLSGRVAIESDGLELSGTVQRSGVDGAQVHTLVQGGAGGLASVLPARFWLANRINLILADLMRETGEALAAGVSFPESVPRWLRHRTHGGRELTRICRWFGDEYVWRVLRDGTVWIGAEAWPEADFAHLELERHRQNGHVLIAPEGLADVEPGTTVDGERVDTVVHNIPPERLTTELQLAT